MPSTGKKRNKKKKILHLRYSLIPAVKPVWTLFFRYGNSAYCFCKSKKYLKRKEEKKDGQIHKI